MSSGTEPTAGRDSRPVLRRVPLTPRRFGLYATAGSSPSAALSIYRPWRGRSRAALLAGQTLLRVRLARPVAMDEPLDLLDALHVPADQVAVLVTPAQRWIIASETAGALAGIVKAGSADDRGLRTEQAHLQRIGGTGLAPRLLDVRTWRGRRALVLEPLTTRRYEPQPAEVADVAVELAAADLTHGDLAPWNLLMTSRGLVVCDWESARAGCTPMADLVHYYCRVGALLRTLDVAGVAALLVGPAGPGARYGDRLGLSPRERTRATRSALHASLQAEHGLSAPEQRFRADVLAALTSVEAEAA